MADRPNKKIVSFRLPTDVLDTLETTVSRQRVVSRNKLVELILRDYCSRGEKSLQDMITDLEARDEQTLDLFA
jgi:metal-responsive CopG/Arc/MetJ family transcriptional regulator